MSARRPQRPPRDRPGVLATGLLAGAAALLCLAPATARARRGAWMGMAVEAAPTGWSVNRVSHRGPAEQAGLKPGDVVTALDGRPVALPAASRATVVAWARGSVHRVTYRRAAQTRTVSLRVARRPKAPGYVRLFLVHRPLPDFTLPRVGAPGNVTLSKLRGRVVLVLFMASWCSSCKVVLPLLSKLQRRLGKRGLDVVAVGRDKQLAPLLAATRSYRLPFAVAHDGPNQVGKVNRIKVVPSLLFVDRFGVVRSYVQGAGYTYAQIARVVRRLLRQRRARPSLKRNTRELWL